jgi:type IV pilus assembly protein PilC
MNSYSYQGLTHAGKTKQGTIVANSEREAVMQLVHKGISVQRMEQRKPSWLNLDITMYQKVPAAEWVLYLRQFATLTEAKVPIIDALRILANQTANKRLQAATLQTEESVRSGLRLSEAMAQHPSVFPAMAIHLIGAGELIGGLDDTLNRLALYFEKQYHLKQKVQSAMIYPAVLLVFAILVIGFLLTNVVPTFAGMFGGLGAELPLITRTVLAVSEWVQAYWWVIFLIVGMGSMAVKVALQRSVRLQSARDYMGLRLPVFGKLTQRATLVRMTRTWSSLLASKVPILSSITVIEQVTMNKVMTSVLVDAKQALEGGESLCEPFRNHWVFPPMVVQMMSIGEQTGTLDAMFAKLSEFYEQEVEQMTDRLKALVEPLLIVFLSVAIGVIVLSIIVPMFDIFNHIH